MNHSDFIAFATEIRIQFRYPEKATKAKDMTTQLLVAIASGCNRNNATFIGHIKCIAEVEDGSFIYCSVLDDSGRFDCTGELSGLCNNILIQLNVLVYGLTQLILEKIVNTALEAMCPSIKYTVSEMSESDSLKWLQPTWR